MKTPAVWMVGFRTTREEIHGIYNEVYQQKSLLGPPLYGPEWKEALDQEICTSLEEQMWQRWGTARPEEDLGGATASILWPSCQTKSHHRTQVRDKDTHNQALNEAREMHQRTLGAAHLLEQNIERLSWAASRAKSAKCECPYSHSHSRRRPQGRHPQSLRSPRLKKHVTFLDQEEEVSSGEGPLREPWGQATGGGEPPGSSSHPRAGAGALPGSTNTYTGCWG